MNSKEEFVAYEYKNMTIKRDLVTIYVDCLANFGWELLAKERQSATPADASVHVETGEDAMVLKFKRNRQVHNKLEVDQLERKCENALGIMNSIQRKSSAHTMSISLGTGILGTALLGFGVYDFVAGSPIIGVLFTVLGILGWGIGFYAYHRIGKKQSEQIEPMIQEQLEIAYGACEQAHTLLGA